MQGMVVVVWQEGWINEWENQQSLILSSSSMVYIPLLFFSGLSTIKFSEFITSLAITGSAYSCWSTSLISLLELFLTFSYSMLFLLLIFSFTFSWFSSRLVNCWICFTLIICSWCRNSRTWMKRSTRMAVIASTVEKMMDSKRSASRTRTKKERLTMAWLTTHTWGCSLVAFLTWYSRKMNTISTPMAIGSRQMGEIQRRERKVALMKMRSLFIRWMFSTAIQVLTVPTKTQMRIPKMQKTEFLVTVLRLLQQAPWMLIEPAIISPTSKKLQRKVPTTFKDSRFCAEHIPTMKSTRATRAIKQRAARQELARVILLQKRRQELGERSEVLEREAVQLFNQGRSAVRKPQQQSIYSIQARLNTIPPHLSRKMWETIYPWSSLSGTLTVALMRQITKSSRVRMRPMQWQLQVTWEQMLRMNQGSEAVDLRESDPVLAELGRIAWMADSVIYSLNWQLRSTLEAASNLPFSSPSSNLIEGIDLKKELKPPPRGLLVQKLTSQSFLGHSKERMVRLTELLVPTIVITVQRVRSIDAWVQELPVTIKWCSKRVELTYSVLRRSYLQGLALKLFKIVQTPPLKAQFPRQDLHVPVEVQVTQPVTVVLQKWQRLSAEERQYSSLQRLQSVAEEQSRQPVMLVQEQQELAD